MGGWFTYRAAKWADELGVDAAVPFYGGGIARDLGEVHCPTLMFFGDQDPYIPMADIEAVQAHHGDAVVVYPGADHGFMRDGSENYDEASATDAWTRAHGVLRRTPPLTALTAIGRGTGSTSPRPGCPARAGRRAGRQTPSRRHRASPRTRT